MTNTNKFKLPEKDEIERNPVAKKMKTIADFLGEERMDQLKDYVIEKLIDDFRQSVDQHFLTPPALIENLWNNVFEEISCAYGHKLSSAMKKAMKGLVESLKDISDNDSSLVINMDDTKDYLVWVDETEGDYYKFTRIKQSISKEEYEKFLLIPKKENE